MDFIERSLPTPRAGLSVKKISLTVYTQVLMGEGAAKGGEVVTRLRISAVDCRACLFPTAQRTNAPRVSLLMLSRGRALPTYVSQYVGDVLQADETAARLAQVADKDLSGHPTWAGSALLNCPGSILGKVRPSRRCCGVAG